MNFFLDPQEGLALFSSNELKYFPADIGNQGQQMIHIEEGDENDKDQEKSKENDNGKVDLENVLKCERGEQKDHQDDEKIIDP